MINKQMLKELETFFATGGVKIFLEAPYNELFKTEFGQRLKRLGITSQAGIVTALGLLTFFLQRKLPADTVFQSAAKEIVADSWPEISKRLFNGFTDFLVSRSTAVPAEEQVVIDKLGQIKSSEDFSDLLAGLAQNIKNQRSTFLDRATERIRKSREKLQSRKRGVLW